MVTRSRGQRDAVSNRSATRDDLVIEDHMWGCDGGRMSFAPSKR